jgi:hypothetical protein
MLLAQTFCENGWARRRWAEELVVKTDNVLPSSLSVSGYWIYRFMASRRRLVRFRLRLAVKRKCLMRDQNNSPLKSFGSWI